MPAVTILTTSWRPWKQARVRVVYLLVSIWALMSEAMSSSSLTTAVYPFMTASIKGYRIYLGTFATSDHPGHFKDVQESYESGEGSRGQDR